MPTTFKLLKLRQFYIHWQYDLFTLGADSGSTKARRGELIHMDTRSGYGDETMEMERTFVKHKWDEMIRNN